MAASIVILNWNGGALVDRAIRSALAQEVDSEVVVVDNASTDGSAQHARTHGVRLIENDTNLGFAEGMNVGFRATTGDPIVFMNCDAVLHPGFVAEATRRLDRDHDVGAVGALVVRMGEDDPDPWDEPGPWILDAGPIGLRRDLRVYLADDVHRARDVFKPNGCAPVVRRAALDAVAERFGIGPFDPVYDTYGEDIDLAFKLWRTGWSTHYEPRAVAGHVRSFASEARVADKRGRLRVNIVASRHRNALRHLPTRELVLTMPAVLAGDVALAGSALVRGDASATRDVVAAWRRLLRERRDLRDFRRRHGPVPPVERRAGPRTRDLTVARLTPD